MESLEELKAIRDGAPEGATHVGDRDKYLSCDPDNRWHGHTTINSWVLVDDFEIGTYTDIRSLSDINRIIELMEFIDDNSDERINQIARNGGDGEHYNGK